jgi:hypothetical protein
MSQRVFSAGLAVSHRSAIKGSPEKKQTKLDPAENHITFDRVFSVWASSAGQVRFREKKQPDVVTGSKDKTERWTKVICADAQ